MLTNGSFLKNNIGEKLSIDEIAVTNGELYTVVTNKKAKGGKGSLLAIISGTKASEVITVLKKIPIGIREEVLEVRLIPLAPALPTCGHEAGHWSPSAARQRQDADCAGSNGISLLEVTLDMSNAMDWIIKGSFPKVTIVTDRFHVQQLVSEAVQEIRITLRKKAIKEKRKAILRARKNKERKSTIRQSLKMVIRKSSS